MLVVNPETELEEIIQNVRTILSTPKGTVPLMRDFGVSWQIVDTLSPELEMKMKEEIYFQIERWEKRAKVRKIKIETSNEGEVKATVTIETKFGVVNVSNT
jgi:phage baseplate assembly protein W